jgi:hypothetical protein
MPHIRGCLRVVSCLFFSQDPSNMLLDLMKRISFIYQAPQMRYHLGDGGHCQPSKLCGIVQSRQWTCATKMTRRISTANTKASHLIAIIHLPTSSQAISVRTASKFNLGFQVKSSCEWLRYGNRNLRKLQRLFA